MTATQPPLLAIVGRPNVGKSTLFNKLVGGRPALVHDTPGLTRDRRYGEADYFGAPIRLVDTGGLDPDAAEEVIGAGIHRQALRAIDEADGLLLVVDGRAGLSSVDQLLAKRLRQTGKKVFLAVNKIDHQVVDDLVHDFHSLGLGAPFAVSAAHGRGIDALLERICDVLGSKRPTPEDEANDKWDALIGGEDDDVDDGSAHLSRGNHLADFVTGRKSYGDSDSRGKPRKSRMAVEDTITSASADPAEVEDASDDDGLEDATVADLGARDDDDSIDGDGTIASADDADAAALDATAMEHGEADEADDEDDEDEDAEDADDDDGGHGAVEVDAAAPPPLLRTRAGMPREPMDTSDDHVREARDARLARREREAAAQPLRVAFVGRPNAGKSSLTNRLLGEERSLVHDVAGTTTDPVDTPFSIGKRNYILVDTAGIRRRAKIDIEIEKIAVSMAISQIERADVVVLVIDAELGPSEQDARLAGMVEAAGRGLVIALNKSDRITGDAAKVKLREDMKDTFHFLAWAPTALLSAQRGDGVDRLLDQVEAVAREHRRRVPTAQLNRFFADVIEEMPPPLHHGRAVRIYYLTQAMIRPPTFMLSTNSADGLAPSYRRFLINRLRERYNFRGTPIRIAIKPKKDRHDDK